MTKKPLKQIPPIQVLNVCCVVLSYHTEEALPTKKNLNSEEIFCVAAWILPLQDAKYPVTWSSRISESCLGTFKIIMEQLFMAFFSIFE
jgi:hypothetical protein